MSDYKHCQVKLYYKQDADIIDHLKPFEVGRQVSAELRRLIRLGWQVSNNRLPVLPVGPVPSGPVGPVLDDADESLLEAVAPGEPEPSPEERVKQNLDKLGGMF